MSTVVQAQPIGTASVPPLPKADSCVLIIFGASGDLTKRKLIPALYDLACAGSMAKEFEVVGVARSEMTSEAFREAMYQSTSKSRDARKFNDACWEGLSKRMQYVTGDINDPGMYTKLADKLADMTKNGSSPNYLFYVSTPASLAAPIIRGLGSVGLNRPSTGGWSRIILEKPFGRDLDTARQLNQVVS